MELYSTILSKAGSNKLPIINTSHDSIAGAFFKHRYGCFLLIKRNDYVFLPLSCQTSLVHFKVSIAIMVSLMVLVTEFSQMDAE
jgi:hypothetical protein